MMLVERAGTVLLLGVAIAALHACGSSTGDADGDQPAVTEGQPEAVAGSVRQERSNPLRNAYFGDLHVHTSWSLDAYILGHPMLNDPSVAYRYGRGDAILDADGNVRGQLAVPLDFMAVTDHDTMFGEVQLCHVPGDPAYDTEICAAARDGATAAFLRLYNQTNQSPPRRDLELCGSSDPGEENKCDQRARHQWPRVREMADAYYEPGRFTTFTAFEFTGNAGGLRGDGGWLHRNVIFRGEDVPEWHGSAIGMGHSPERFWEWLEEACTAECEALAIPHNTNSGQGVALAPNNADGTPFTEEILRRRAAMEPLIEIFQVKGNSECAPGFLSSDEDCTYEHLSRACGPGEEPGQGPGQGCAIPSDYVRSALKTGLTVEADFGINPFKYGIIASTDDHRAMPGSTVESEWQGSYFGEIGAPILGGMTINPRNNPGGLAAVWATENTRDAIFDAFRRRETFGTSGTRIRVRLFAGWQFADDLHARQDLLEEAYRTGVPMGADLPPIAGDAPAPRFVVWATKDANSANLQKIQIVKGWAGEDGQTHEMVYDVVCADGLEPDGQTHRCADNGAQVNLADCSISSGVGAPELGTTWTDPDFDATVRAFYYARVLENPTCRWSTHQALATNTALPDGVPPVTKERAWSSPIWYTPAGVR